MSEFPKGRKKDILFEDYFIEDQRTGVRHKKDDEFVLWADNDLKTTIEGVEGVIKTLQLQNNQYYVYIDHRYDMEVVKREVEAAIRCKS